jgi:hypothetical protein
VLGDHIARCDSKRSHAAARQRQRQIGSISQVLGELIEVGIGIGGLAADVRRGHSLPP